MAEKIVLTRDSQQKLMEELRWMETVELSKVREEIGSAKELGDLSENAEYDAACEHQARVQERIRALKQVLEQAEIV